MKPPKKVIMTQGRFQGMRYIKETLKEIGTPQALEELAKIDAKTLLMRHKKNNKKSTNNN